jgi:hypothetical protein
MRNLLSILALTLALMSCSKEKVSVLKSNTTPPEFNTKSGDLDRDAFMGNWRFYSVKYPSVEEVEVFVENGFLYINITEDSIKYNNYPNIVLNGTWVYLDCNVIRTRTGCDCGVCTPNDYKVSITGDTMSWTSTTNGNNWKLVKQ